MSESNASTSTDSVEENVKVKTYVVVDDQTLDTEEYSFPSNSKFRDAWTLSGSIITVDVEKAKDIWKNKLRLARKPVLEKLDAEFFRALEDGNTDKQKQIAADKKALRDITILPQLLNATTIEDIEAVWPDILNQ